MFLTLPPPFPTPGLFLQEERQALLHEGSGAAAVNAFVEVFDNADNRFSLENSDEVVLRRTVGHKKDEFFLQRKRATKNKVMSLLEGAGFSWPYRPTRSSSGMPCMCGRWTRTRRRP